MHGHLAVQKSYAHFECKNTFFMLSVRNLHFLYNSNEYFVFKITGKVCHSTVHFGAGWILMYSNIMRHLEFLCQFRAHRVFIEIKRDFSLHTRMWWVSN